MPGVGSRTSLRRRHHNRHRHLQLLPPLHPLRPAFSFRRRPRRCHAGKTAPSRRSVSAACAAGGRSPPRLTRELCPPSASAPTLASTRRAGAGSFRECDGAGGGVMGGMGKGTLLDTACGYAVRYSVCYCGQLCHLTMFHIPHAEEHTM